MRSDNSPEYRSLGGTILADQGIIYKRIVAYTLEQNRLLERLNYSLTTMARLMLLTIKLLLRFQGFAVQTICYLQNRIAIGPERKSLEEAFIGRKPSIRHLQTFRYIAYTNIPSIIRDKLNLISYKTILISYLPTSKQYQLYNPRTKSIIISLNPRFKENLFQDQLDELEDLKKDLKGLNLIELVLLDISKLLILAEPQTIDEVSRDTKP